MNTRGRIIGLVLLVLAACLRGGPAQASKEKNAANSETTSSAAQVDGIVDAAVDALWQQCDNYWHGGDYPRIVALDRIITQADPHFIECYTTGAWLMESLGQMSDAEAFYQEAVLNNPHASYPYYHLGFFYFNTLHDYTTAAQVFKKDTEQSDAGINDWKMLAHSYTHAGDLSAAVLTWREIKSRWPNGLAVDANLNRALTQLREAQDRAAPKTRAR